MFKGLISTQHGSEAQAGFAQLSQRLLKWATAYMTGRRLPARSFQGAFVPLPGADFRYRYA